MERLLGEGGFGSVWEARRGDNTHLAVKIALPKHATATARLLREAEILQRVGPPAVPAYVDQGTLADGSAFVAMEFVELPTLAKRLEMSSAPMSVAEVHSASAAILDALAAVHAAGYVHLDLKPENIFLTSDLVRARLFDFGLAELVGEKVATIQQPDAEGEAFAGTPEYMSPEQCEGKADLDPRADLYAVGVLLYEMLTGRPPFFGSSGNEVQQAHLSRRPPRPSTLVEGVPSKLEEVILRCLAKDRTARFESASALRMALSEAGAAADPAPIPRASTAAPRARAVAQKKRMGLLFFQGPPDVEAARSSLASLGGELVHSTGRRFVGAFDGGTSENPVRRAVGAARELLTRGVTSSTLVDLASVTVQVRANGAVRYLSSLFEQEDRYPGENEYRGVLVTAAAADAIAHSNWVLMPGREGIFRLYLSDGLTNESTQVRLGASPLIGRDLVLQDLLEGARRTREEHRPTLTTVLGEAGYGKSHLCTTLTQSLTAAPGLVLELKVHEPLVGDREETLQALLRRLLNVPIGTPPPADGGHALLVRTFGTELGEETWPAVALALEWIASDAPVLKSRAAAPGVLREQVIRATGEALRTMAAREPLYLVLDDAHYADSATLDAIEYATRSGDLALWVCVFARPALATWRPRFGDRAERKELIQLQALDDRTAAELCRHLLMPAEKVPSKVIERLAERTQGVPLLAVELVRGLKREGLVRQRQGGSWYVLTDELERLPDLPLLEWLASRELQALPAELSAHARLAALLGTEFTAAEFQGVLSQWERQDGADETPLDAQVGIQRLLKAGILVSHRAGTLGYRQAMVREAVSRTVPQATAKQIHLAAFRYYESTAENRHRLPSLAFHAAAAGLNQRAAELYLAIAEQAHSRHAYLDAEFMYSRGLALLSPEDLRARMVALKGRGLMRYRMGRYEDSVADLQQACGLAEKLHDVSAEIEIVLDQATALDFVNDYERSRARLEEARALSAQAQSPLIETRLLMGMGRSQWRLGQLDEARITLAQAVEKASAVGDPGYEALVASLLMLQSILFNLGRIDEAEAISQRVKALCTEKGDRMHLGVAYNNGRYIWISRKDVRGAVNDALAGLKITQELGEVGLEYFYTFNIAEMLYQAGELEESQTYVSRTLDLERRHPEIAPRPNGLLLQARLLVFASRIDEARRTVDEILAHQRRARNEARATNLFGAADEILVRMVDLSSRMSAAAEWEELRKASVASSVGQERLEVVEMHGLSALRQGRRTEGIRALEAALQMASTIPNLMEGHIRRALEAAPSKASAVKSAEAEC